MLFDAQRELHLSFLQPPYIVAGRPEVALGIHRSDYMLDAPSQGFLQVELNTIASSFGCLSSQVTRMHNYILSRLPSSVLVSCKQKKLERAACLADQRCTDSLLLCMQLYTSNKHSSIHWLSTAYSCSHRIPPACPATTPCRASQTASPLPHVLWRAGVGVHQMVHHRQAEEWCSWWCSQESGTRMTSRCVFLVFMCFGAVC